MSRLTILKSDTVLRERRAGAFPVGGVATARCACKVENITGAGDPLAGAAVSEVGVDQSLRS